MELNPETANAGYIELDWNDKFVEFLHNNGYTGQNDEDVVNKWFNDVCRTVLLQEQADLDYGMQTQGRDDVIIKDNSRDDSEE